MSDGSLGVFDPRKIADHLNFLQGFEVLPPSELFHFLLRVRELELDHQQQNPFWRETVSSISAVMERALGIPGAEARREAELHVRTMLGEGLLWPTYISAYLHKPDRILSFIEVSGSYELQSALDGGKGVLLAQYHWGPFQMLLPALLAMGYSVLQCFGDVEAAAWATGLIRRCHPELAGRMETLVVPDSTIGARVIRALGRGHLVALPPEVSESPVKPKLRTEFLGHRVYAPEGPAFLAATAGVPLIPVCLEAHGPYLRVHFHSPIKAASKTRGGLQSVIDQLFHTLEEEILKQPHQWRGWGFFDEMIAAEV